MDAKMFCFQCQEAAKGTGCTIKGVCGKDDETANRMDLLLFVTKGVSVVATLLRNAGVEVPAYQPFRCRCALFYYNKCELRYREYYRPDCLWFES